ARAPTWPWLYLGLFALEFVRRAHDRLRRPSPPSPRILRVTGHELPREDLVRRLRIPLSVPIFHPAGASDRSRRARPRRSDHVDARGRESLVLPLGDPLPPEKGRLVQARPRGQRATHQSPCVMGESPLVLALSQSTSRIENF